MSYKHAVLCFAYALFLILGAVIFMFLEREEVVVIADQPDEWTQIKAIITEVPSVNNTELPVLIDWLQRVCPNVSSKTIYNISYSGNHSAIIDDTEQNCDYLAPREVLETVYYLRFIDSLYFSMTVATTIGYGNVAPSNGPSRIVCMIYAVVGIPLTGMLLAWTSQMFGEKLFQLFKSKLDSEKQRSKVFIALATVVYIGIGFVVFIFIPAVAFSFIEDWTYLESVYYAFITLTTIGFGDFVTGNNYTGVWLYIYQILVIVWILVGLGYWVMVANFITIALKSKEIHSSLIKSANEVKKIMGLANTDPKFLSQHSKASFNFLMQLCNMMVMQQQAGDLPDGLSNGNTNSQAGAERTQGASGVVGIPGIAALFGSGPGVCKNPAFSPFFTPGLMLDRNAQTSSPTSVSNPDTPTSLTSDVLPLSSLQDEGPEVKLETDTELCEDGANKLTTEYENVEGIKELKVKEDDEEREKDLATFISALNLESNMEDLLLRETSHL